MRMVQSFSSKPSKNAGEWGTWMILPCILSPTSEVSILFSVLFFYFYISFLNLTLSLPPKTKDEDKKLIGEKTIPYDLIVEVGVAKCKLVLEKVQNAVRTIFSSQLPFLHLLIPLFSSSSHHFQKAFSVILAVSKGDYYLNDCGVSVAEGDMFYVLDRDGLTWRVKPISRNGKDFDIPRDYLQVG